MNKEEVEEILKDSKWEIETWFSDDTMFVAHRNYSTIIGYPKSNKYRENGTVNVGLLDRITLNPRSKKWFNEQLIAKDKWIAELLEKGAQGE